jgi:thiol-disulfide isomerase/thioredoxin
MRIRWAIAVVGIVALAALTVTTQMPWLTRRQPAMQEIRRDPLREAETPGGPAMLACPADAKRANLDFTMKDASGQDVSLSRYKGKVIVLDFWATWCGPCKIEIPWFQEFERQNKDKGFAVIGVAMDEEGWDVVKPFAKYVGINYRLVIGDETITHLYGGVEAMPTTFLIDREGRIASVHVGLSSKRDFEDEIQELLRDSSNSSVSAELVRAK